MPTIEEAYRVFWIIKGHLNVSEETVLGSYDNYFKRIWYNEESYIHSEGFLEAYKIKKEGAKSPL